MNGEIAAAPEGEAYHEDADRVSLGVYRGQSQPKVPAVSKP